MTIQDILNDLKIDYLESGHHHCRSGWLQIRSCPFCHSDNYHLGWNIQKSYGVCWRCGGHSVWSIFQAFGLRAEKIKQILPHLRATTPRREHEIARVSQLIEPKNKGPLQDCHISYLEERGFDPHEIARLWRVEGIGLDLWEKLSWRLYIPIQFRGETVSWTTRSIGKNNTQRYISASEDKEKLSHKKLIYGIDFCRESIIIVEGPTDAWAIGPGAGALFGTAFTPAQIRLLLDYPRRYICFDSSIEAQRKAKHLASILSVFPGSTENIVTDAKDPAESSEKEIKLIRRVAGL